MMGVSQHRQALLDLCEVAGSRSPMARIVEGNSLFHDWVFERFPHKWITSLKPKGQEADLLELTRCCMFFDWLQICPIKGIFSGYSDPPENYQELDDIRRGQVMDKGARRTVQELHFQMGDQAVTQWHRDPLDDEMNYEVAKVGRGFMWRTGVKG